MATKKELWNKRDGNMTNFDFLLSNPQVSPFADVTVAIQKILHIAPPAYVLIRRRAMEFANRLATQKMTIQ